MSSRLHSPAIASLDVASLFDLTGRVAIVTGGSRGLGSSVARGFAAAGAKVVVASRKLDACEAVVSQISEAGGAALGVACNMGDAVQVEQLVARTIDHYGRIDCVVNNAATALRVGVTSFDDALWHKAMDVNVWGPIRLIHECVPHLRQSDLATVINVLSVGGIRGSMSLLGYGSAKAALRHATESIAAELAPLGIRVNAIAPGPFATTMMNTSDESFQADAIERTLLKRMADPDEIVGAALFLASAASSFVTGSIVVVDGGLLA
ncbi:MAG TPA: glucose 1-dehydrogenase [Acidimicrobiales bacterium]|nr:glucose 1-dehydrogenase [Acidimicrobiales bacterium]